MERLFESEWDKYTNPLRYEFIRTFNNKAEAIASKYPECFKDKSIFDVMTFDLENPNGARPVINDETIPQPIKDEIIKAFREHTITKP